MEPLTRPLIRDGVRRRLGLPIALDRGGDSGDPGSKPRPTNITINTAADEILSELDDRLHFNVSTSYTLSVTAQTARGPYVKSLRATPGFTPTLADASFFALRYAGWCTGTDTSTYQALTVKPFAIVEQDRAAYLNDLPSTPTNVWLDSGNLCLYPAPSAAGLLIVRGDTSVVSPLDDETDKLTVLPTNLGPAFLDLVARKVAMEDSDDTILAERKQWIVPKAEASLQRILAWKANENATAAHGPRPFRYRNR